MHNCVTCNKTLERKKYRNGQFEPIKQWQKRLHCDLVCLNSNSSHIAQLFTASQSRRITTTPDETKRCVTCDKPLERKRYGKQKNLEAMEDWQKRKYCNNNCKYANPVEIARLKEAGLVGTKVIISRYIDNRPELLARLQEMRESSNRPSEKRKQAARDRWARGEVRPPLYVKRSRDEGIFYNGLTDDEIFAIQLDQRTQNEIAKAFSVSRSTIGKVKKANDSFVAPSGPRSGDTGKPVITPSGRFKNATLAAKDFNITSTTASRWASQEKNGWRYE